MMPKIFPFRTVSRKSIWLRTFLALVGTSLALGVEGQAPKLSPFSWQLSPLVVSAQEAPIAGVSEQEILEYARVAYEIEQDRQLVYDEIEELMKGDVPELACNDEDSLEQTNEDVREVFLNWCRRSEEIIEESELSISRFNKIHELQEDNDELKERIQAEVEKIRESEDSEN
mgnify:CR=1 FL=1